MSIAPRTIAVAATCAILIGLIGWALRAPDVGPPTTSLPSVAALDSLEPYLRPVAAAPRLDEYAAFVPAFAPSAPLEELTPVLDSAPAPPPTTWRVSAILVSGTRPIAIINDESVGVGTRLSDGTRVEAIERDRVIVRAPDGTRRTLWLSAG